MGAAACKASKYIEERTRSTRCASQGAEKGAKAVSVAWVMGQHQRPSAHGSWANMARVPKDNAYDTCSRPCGNGLPSGGNGHKPGLAEAFSTKDHGLVCNCLTAAVPRQLETLHGVVSMRRWLDLANEKAELAGAAPASDGLHKEPSESPVGAPPARSPASTTWTGVDSY